MATRVLQAEVQPTEYFLVYFQEGIDQIRASIFGGKYYLPSHVSPQSNTDIFTAYAAITKSRYRQAFALHDQFYD